MFKDVRLIISTDQFQILIKMQITNCDQSHNLTKVNKYFLHYKYNEKYFHILIISQTLLIMLVYKNYRLVP